MPNKQSRSAARFLSRYLPLLIWIGFISFASTDQFSADNTSRIIGPLVTRLFPNVSAHTLDLIHFITRKLAHLTEYGILAFLAARAFRTSPRAILNRHWVAISFALVATYALLDEYHQSFVPSRTASIIDSFIDMTGGLTVLLILSWRHNKRIHASNSNN